MRPVPSPPIPDMTPQRARRLLSEIPWWHPLRRQEAARVYKQALIVAATRLITPHVTSEADTPAYWRTVLASCDSLEEAVQIAVGGASACWSDLDRAGAFESTRAAAIAEALTELCRDYVR